jgi:flagellar motor switch protein FliM
VVDTLFGGDSRIPPKLSDRDLSATELRIVRRMMDGLTDEYEKAWQPVQPVRFEFVREESHFLLADIAEPDDRVLQCAFEVQLNGQQGRLLFCLPFWLLDSLRAQLFEPTRNLQVEMDSHWANRLEAEVQSAKVELVAVLARQQMRIADVLSLNVGDIVPIEVEDTVTAYVDGLPMVTGQYGVRNGHYAIKVAQVNHPADLIEKLGRNG